MLEYQWISTLLHFAEGLIQVLMIVLELMGALVITYGAVVIFLRFLRLQYTEPSTDIRIRMARTLSLGLEFYLAAEIFKTVSVREVRDLMIVGVIVVLRSLMTLLIHWELKNDLEELRAECQNITGRKVK